MHSIRVRITAITIIAILTSILAVFVASFLIIRSETDQNSVGMMNLSRKSRGSSISPETRSSSSASISITI